MQLKKCFKLAQASMSYGVWVNHLRLYMPNALPPTEEYSVSFNLYRLQTFLLLAMDSNPTQTIV